MNREQQEMALWRKWYSASRLIARVVREAEADAAVAAFRKRYPVEPTAPPAVWYDEPPFPRDGKSYPCWVDGDAVHADVCWYDGEWHVWIVGSACHQPLAGHRVSPIAKPPEPPQ